MYLCQTDPTRHQLYGHLSPITKTIQVRRTGHAGHCWGSRDELINDVLQWTPTYGRAKAGRPARTYIQQLCEDTGCSPENLPESMNDREKWGERVRDIRANGTTWWWWWWWWCVKMDLAFNNLQYKTKPKENTLDYLLSITKGLTTQGNYFQQRQKIKNKENLWTNRLINFFYIYIYIYI